MTKSFYVSDAVSAIGMDYRVVGDAHAEFDKATTLADACTGAIVWVAPLNPGKKDLVSMLEASVIICDAESATGYVAKAGKVLIVTGNPRLAFLRVVAAIFQVRPQPEVHPTAYVHPGAVIGKDVYIGPFTYIGKSRIGDGAVIHGHVHLYDNVSIGDRVIVHAGTVIGSDGFGYQKNQDGVLEKFPHIGGVVIENDVEIGANTTIDRGTLGNTLIRKRARIDNLVHVAHNVDVGEDAGVVANVMIGGSTKIGAGAWVAPSVTLRDGISIGAGATIGMSALVTKPVPAGETWVGIPAKNLKKKNAQSLGDDASPVITKERLT